MVTKERATSNRTSRLVDVLAVIAGGSWGAVAGGTLLALLAIALGAPTGTDSGEFIPGPGWNRFTAFIIGLPIGFAVGAIVALRATRRWPRLAGVPVAIVGAIAIVSLVADSTQWDTNLSLLVVVLPGVAFVVWHLRRARRSSAAPRSQSD